MTACHIFCHGIIIDIKSMNLKKNIQYKVSGNGTLFNNKKNRL
jgi:hypothetical protein